MITYTLGDSARLGNQMFCIATVYGYAKKHNVSPMFQEYKYFDLPKLTIKHENYYKEKNKFFEEIPYLPNLLIEGYFQSEKYFLNAKDTILNDVFKFPDNQIDFISVHIRRGDYLLYPNFFVNCSLNYYKESMNMLGGNNENFMFFSDDIQYCKDNFKGDNIYFSELNELEDLKLMSQCKHNIISASSYSWWGAWLNRNIDKKVIAPSEWWGKDWTTPSKIESRDIMPESWFKINPYI